jgi:hypothetical protein
MDPDDADQRLVPLLRASLAPDRRDLDAWCSRLGGECRSLLSLVLPLSDAEREFVARINERGEIAPELLSTEADMQARLRTHPALLWKAHNVREYVARLRGTGDAGKP